MNTIPTSFSSGWHGRREKQWQRWVAAIEQDRNYARILLGLPLIEPVRTEVRLTAERLGYRPPTAILED